MSDQRLIDIETRIAHQDQAFAELNDVVTDQQSRIMQLERLCASLAERVAAIPESQESGGEHDERPPHY